MDLKETLQLLEQDNPNHWTSDGLPVVAVVAELFGQPITRKDITEADPTFTRESLTLEPIEEAEEDPEPVGEVDLKAKLDDFDKQLGALERERKELERRFAFVTQERRELDAKITSEYDFQTDQDRRMAHIRSNNERRMRLALERQEQLKGIDPRLLQPIQSPIDAAQLVRKGQAPKVPPRIFKE